MKVATRAGLILPMLGLLAVLSATVCCDRNGVYPYCHTDEQCAEIVAENPEGLTRYLSHDHLAPPLFCVDEVCRECRVDSHCPQGSSCRDFMCVQPPSNPPDAGSTS